MSVDFSKQRVGDVVAAFCCNGCLHRNSLIPKHPADSGTKSWLCDVCGHYGIGSMYRCKISDWLVIEPIEPYGRGFSL